LFTNDRIRAWEYDHYNRTGYHFAFRRVGWRCFNAARVNENDLNACDALLAGEKTTFKETFILRLGLMSKRRKQLQIVP